MLNSKWGLGAMLELDTPPINSLLLAVQFVYHPVPQAGLVLAPGYVFTEGGDEDSLLLRVGMTWEFEIGRRTSLAPEMFYDIEEGGAAFGRHRAGARVRLLNRPRSG